MRWSMAQARINYSMDNGDGYVKMKRTGYQRPFELHGKSQVVAFTAA